MMRRHYLALVGGLLVSACADVPTGPQVDPMQLDDAPVMSVVGAESVTYDFRTLASSPCDGSMFSSPFDDLTFVEGLFAACYDGAKTFLLAYDPAGPQMVTNTILLHEQATAVSLEAWWFGGGVAPPSITAYDAAGNALDSEAWVSSSGTESHLVSGDGIASIAIVAPNMQVAAYSLTVTYGASDPTDRTACRGGAWAEYGFRNQGQCVRFVETGEDSRG